MNFKYLFGLFVIFVLQCQGTKVRSNQLAWGYNGWGVAPDKIQNPVNLSKEEKLEYFYIVAKGNAIPRAIEVDSHSFMESTCKISALRDNEEELFKQIIFSVDPKSAQNTAVLQKAKSKLFTSKKGEIAYCRPTGTGDKYTTCDCVIYLKYEGGRETLKKELKTLQ